MLPPIASTIDEIRKAAASARGAGKSIGFVPTMGALHTGHASLIRSARAATDFVVVSIFVNPTQFGPQEDLARYPRTLEADRQLCGAVGADVLFVPQPEEIYPPDFRTSVEVTGLQDSLCGPSRPGHFRGVATVVLKLFNIVLPDVAFFGQKDAQQVRILQQMARDLNLLVRVEVLPTVREPDGLAMSSRNSYLSPGLRPQAALIYRALEKIREMASRGEKSVDVLESALAAAILAIPGARIDYARIVNSETLRRIETIDRPALAAVAVYLGSTRLIDNVVLTL